MKTIEWPKSDFPTTREAPPQVLLPELELTDADYEAAAEALRKLDDCFFEVVFVHEVAARNCRERQLKAELLRNQAVVLSGDQRKTPTPISRFHSLRSRKLLIRPPA